MSRGATLTHEQARSFYDRLGSKQDWQRFYEDPAVRVLIRQGDFEQAAAVVEFGCGTGRLAERLLANHLGDRATYLAVDLSATMVSLTRHRLARFGDRVRVVQTDGTPRLAEAAASCDRFISTYVLDLLSADDGRAVIAEAHRLLRGGGRLGLVSLTHATTAPARLVERLWSTVYHAHPSWVGGCRPVSLRESLGSDWLVTHGSVVTSFAITSEVIVAQKVSNTPV